MNKSCIVFTRGAGHFGVIANVEANDLFCEFTFIDNHGAAVHAKLELPQVHEVANLLREFLNAPVKQKE